MAKGRKRKPGKRTPSGQLSRAKQPVVTYDKGTERAQAMQALYGQDNADAIGRAYRAGFLGSGSEAKAMLDKARQVSKAYWAAYDEHPIRSCIASNDNAGGIPDPERIRKREERLREDRAEVNSLGHNVRRAFDQLVIDVNPDFGPRWLDSLLKADRAGRMQDPADVAQLRLALEGLRAIT